MRFAAATLTSITAVLLTACAPTKQKPEVVADCTFPENPSQKAPTWICPARAIDGSKDIGFGMHQKSGAGYQFSLDQASAKARVDLATQVKASAEGMIKAFVETTGGGATETVDRVASTTSKLITAETLSGSKLVRSTQDEKGNVYVLVGMDIEASRRQMQQALQTSMRNEPAAWQRLQGNRSQAEMQAEILKMGDRR